MTDETNRHMKLIRELVSAYIDHPAQLHITANEASSSVYWRLQACSDDHPKIIGKGGAHVRALMYLASELGESVDKTYKFRVLEPIEPAFDEPMIIPPRTARGTTFDVQPFIDLLYQFAREFANEQVLTSAALVGPENELLTYLLTIHTADRNDYGNFISAHDGSPNGETIVGSLGTLWRSMAYKQGVEFKIEVKNSWINPDTVFVSPTATTTTKAKSK